MERDSSQVGGALACGIAVVLLTASPTFAQSRPTDTPNPIREQLRSRLETAADPAGIVVGSETVMAHEALPEFYLNRDYRPAWSDERGPLTEAHRLVNSVRAADQHGLDPGDYHLHAIEARLWKADASRRAGSTPEPAELVDLDLLLTDAFLVLGSHLLVGRVEPTTIDAEWFVDERRQADLLGLLNRALSSNRVEEVFSSLPPQQPGYTRLKQALKRYRAIAAVGGWQEVPAGPKLEKGMQDPRVLSVRARLLATGDLSESEQPTEDFDEAVAEAVRSFQARHGLEPDGVLGAATLEAMNVPADARVHQIELNLERWRWLPDKLGERYLLVNIPAFDLDVFEGTQSVLNMRVVVGKPFRRTPVFSAVMTYLVLSPYWNVPPNIAALDIVPAVRKEPDYLAKKGIKVFQGWGAEGREIDPAAIDWSQVSRGNLPYHFRQEPGPLNALGAVKFMFPNIHNVYLHDTPSRELFARPDRSFSSGCIRIEQPLELAEYLLQDEPSWNREKIVSVIEKRIEQTVRLPRTIPVHLEYWTSFTDATGAINFRKDIYGRDGLLDAALHEDPPSPNTSTSGAP